MQIKEFLCISTSLFLILIIFFYKFFFSGLIPFPADNLITNYSPWKTYSYYGYNPGSFPDKAQYFDTLRQIYPWKTFSIDSLKNGEIPFWNTYNFSGSPLLANSQSAVFYPLGIFYLVLSQITAWSFLILLQPFLSGIFTYFFAREIKIGKLGAVFASIIFSYSLFMSVFLEYNTIGHVILWLPLSLYFIERIIKKINSWNIALFVMSLLFSFLAGHIQIFGFVITFTFIYALVRIFQREWKISRKVKFILIFFFLNSLLFGLASFQLFPTLELINLSARTPQDYNFLLNKLLIQFNQLILLISPDFFGNPVTRNYTLSDSYPGNAMYIGLIPIIFTVFSITFFKENKHIKIFSIASIVLLAFLTRSLFTELFYSINIPFFSTGSPNNAIFLLSFSLSILAGFGIENFIRNKDRLLRVTISVAFLFVLLWIFILIIHPQVSLKNFIYSNLILVVFFFFTLSANFIKLNRNFFIIIFITITIFDLFYFFQKFNSFVPRSLIFPQTPVTDYLKKKTGINRVWGYGSAGIDANFATQFKFFSPDGYDPLYPKRYGELIQASKDGKIHKVFTNQTRSDAVIAPGYGEKDLSLNIYRLRILDLLGVKYILDRVENGSTEITFPKNRFKLIYETDGWRIFENLKSIPRVFLTSDYKVFNNNKEFEKIFFSENLNPSKTILLEEYPAEKITNKKNIDQNLNDNVKIIFYTPKKILLNAESRKKQFLFISDVFYPSWKAFIDSKETKIYRADYAFRAILVPAGKHNVEFRYDPVSFALGLKVSIISLIILIGFSMLIPRMVKNE
ncbi:MAG: YfhO family protein [Candidatus Pacearchaeota archaeon]